jgi:hypothetical protein
MKHAGASFEVYMKYIALMIVFFLFHLRFRILFQSKLAIAHFLFDALICLAQLSAIWFLKVAINITTALRSMQKESP